MRRFVAPFILLLICSLSASAHHATAVEYEISKTVALKGVITKVDWTNPHIHVHMDVKEENWDIEFVSPGAVIVAGLSREALKPGAMIIIKGYPTRSAKSPHAACATEVKLADGTTAHFVVGI